MCAKSADRPEWQISHWADQFLPPKARPVVSTTTVLRKENQGRAGAFNVKLSTKSWQKVTSKLLVLLQKKTNNVKQ
jgi:hypothetical protein